MIDIFPAIERRFKSNPELVRRCRKVYEGVATGKGRGLLPYVEVHIGVGDADLDTFSTDVERIEVEVLLFSQGDGSRNIHRMLEIWMRTFDDVALIGADYTSAAFRRTPGSSGPTLVDSVYEATLAYEWIGQLRVPTPVTSIGG